MNKLTDPKLAIKEIYKNIENIQNIDETLFNDESFMLKAIRKDSTLFSYASDNLKNNRKFLLKAIKQSSEILELMMTEQNIHVNKEFILEAINLKAQCFMYVSPEFKDDMDIVNKALEADLKNLHYASETTKNNRDLVLKAIKDGAPIEPVSHIFGRDREIMIAAISHSDYAFRYTHSNLTDDRSFVIDAIKLQNRVFKLAIEEFQNDLEIAKLVFELGGDPLDGARQDVLNNREFVKKVVAKNGVSLVNCNDKYKDDKEIVLIAVRQDPMHLRFASKNIQNLVGTLDPVKVLELMILGDKLDMQLPHKSITSKLKI